MPISTDGKQEIASWKIHTGGLCAGPPRLTGNRNPAVLRCDAERALRLESAYDPPNNNWIMLIFAVLLIALIFLGVLLGISAATIGGTGGGMLAAAYFLVLFLRKRKTILDIDASLDAVVDQENGRMAFLVPLENKEYWMVLEFEKDFAKGLETVRGVLGPRLQTSSIGKINMGFVRLLLTIVLLFILLFGYFILKGLNAR